jgi:hypothetical protein
LRGQDVGVFALPEFQSRLLMARENEKVNAHGICDLNRKFIAFRRAEASSLG